MGVDEPPALSPRPNIARSLPVPRLSPAYGDAVYAHQSVPDPAGGLGVATPCFISDCGRLMHRLTCSRHRRRWLSDLATPSAVHRKGDAISDCTHS